MSSPDESSRQRGRGGTSRPEGSRDFLAGGGEMGALVRAHDWAATPLGVPARWPQGLKTSVRLLLATGHPMFIWWGPELIQFYNDAYRRSIGPERHPSALGQGGRECWAEIWDIIGPQIEKVMAGEGHTWHENQLVPITRHGRREDVYWTYSYGPIDEPGAPNGVGGVLVVCTETTEQVLAEQRLKAAHEALRAEDRRKDEFLAMLAHELRNPLAPIRNASELLARSPDADPQSRTLGDLIARQAVQLTRLVDDLLDMSRISQGRIELERQPVDLAAAVAMAIESVEPFVRERRHELVYRPPAEAPWVEGDRARVVQSIANVLSNAAKYTEPGGRIEVDLGIADDQAVVAVTDDGAGISPEMLPRVFDLFVQADRTLDRSQGGLGIGLSVVRRLVEMHGGDITAASDGLGRGSTFRIRLPRIAPPAPGATPPDEPVRDAKRILVVDDNADGADALARLLALDGHDTEAVYSAEEALARAGTADVVLLDIGLPGMDGYEVARRLRAAGSAARLVAVTGYGQADDVRRATEAGFDDHVTKPVDFAALERLLEGGA